MKETETKGGTPILETIQQAEGETDQTASPEPFRRAKTGDVSSRLIP